MCKIDGDTTDIGPGPGQRNQDTEHDRGYADHVYKNVERMLVRRGIARQHLHELAIAAHLSLP